MKTNKKPILLIYKIFYLFFWCFLIWNAWILAELIWWKYHNPTGLTAFMALRNDERIKAKKSPILPHPWTRYSFISINLKKAVVAEEDTNFIAHHGFDWQGIQTAFKKDLNRKSAVAGGSTITQQLAKNLFLSPRRSLIRKLEEALITIMIEVTWDKRRILEVYLNTIEWGDGIYGCEAASEHYFHKSVNQLTAYEAATLASMIPKPKFYDRNGFSNYLINKTDIIQYRMDHVSVPK